jgi:hypothetical protein
MSGMPKNFHTKIVGMTFVPGYPENVYTLRDAEAPEDDDDLFGDDLLEEKSGEVEIRLAMRRNPQNPHDANAIEVHAPQLGEKSMLGHVPAPIAARLAPVLDAGGEWCIFLERIAVVPGKESNPGLHVNIFRNDIQYEDEF